MGALQDITGKRFHRLVALARIPTFTGKTLWLCRCYCGNEGVVEAGNLKSGATKSCGCLKREQMATLGMKNRTHGEARSPEFRAWYGMKQRCYHEKDNRYLLYGARGITVCDHWRNSFDNFLSDMGRRPSDVHSLDRINNDGNYDPSNCRWATRSQQNRNRRPFTRRRRMENGHFAY